MGMSRDPIRLLGLTVLGVGLTGSLGLTWAAGEIYEAVAANNDIALVDRPVLNWVLSWRTSGLAGAVTAFTQLGGPVIMPLIAVVGAVALAVWWRSVVPVLVTAVAGAGSVAMTMVSKPLVGRERPPRADAVAPFETSASFPSGHALNATVIVGVLVYLFVFRQRRAWLDWLALAVGGVFVVAMGLSRVVLGHHWLTDVLAGWLLGLGWLVVVITGHWLMLVPGYARRRVTDVVGTSAAHPRPATLPLPPPEGGGAQHQEPDGERGPEPADP